MLDDRRQRYRERRGDLAHRHCVTPRQAVEDRSPRRIGERPKSAIECTVTIVNHMVKYPRDARLVKLRACASHTIEVRVSRNVCQSLALLPRTRAAKAALRVLSLLAWRGVDRSSTSCSARGLVRRGPCSDGLAPSLSCSEPVLLRACLAPRVLLRASCSACLARGWPTPMAGADLPMGQSWQRLANVARSKRQTRRWVLGSIRVLG